MMGTPQVVVAGNVWMPRVAEGGAERRWYAAYTCANHEKSVAKQLEARSVEPFLPVYEKLSRWKDRRVKVQLPLFSGYVFVRMRLEEKLRVLQVPGWCGWWDSTDSRRRSPTTRSRRCATDWGKEFWRSRVRTCRWDGGCGSSPARCEGSKACCCR